MLSNTSLILDPPLQYYIWAGENHGDQPLYDLVCFSLQ